MNRIVSLIASSTEIVHALGMGGELVGRSHECDYPECVKALPAVTSPKFSTDGTSYEIDQRVKAIVQESLSVYRVDADRLEQLRPTHIITQDQCQVCAVSLKDVEDATCHIIHSQPKIVSLKPDCLDDIWGDIARVAESLDIEKNGDALIERCRKKMSDIQATAGVLPKSSVVIIEWIEPLMAAGNWMPELVDMAGGINLLGAKGAHSPFMSFEDLAKADPDVILVSPCGFDIARTMVEIELLTKRCGWNELKAFQGQRIYVVDGNQYFNRPGPRVVESLEIMAEILHPEHYPARHRGQGWIKIEQ